MLHNFFQCHLIGGWLLNNILRIRQNPFGETWQTDWQYRFSTFSTGSPVIGKSQMQANDLLIVLFFFLTAVTNKTRSQRVFSSVQTCVLVDVNQPLPWFFTLWPREDSFSVSWALERICRRFSPFCSILLQDLTPLH